jgi:hypothetical protein
MGCRGAPGQWRPRTVPTTLRQPIAIEGVDVLVMELLAG